MSLARGFSRSSSRKNGREQTPPTSPKRSFSRRRNPGDHMDKPVISKLQISAPVELISTTNMISYTSPSLRNSLGGSANPAANLNGQISSHKSSGSISSHKHKQSISGNQKSKESISLKTEQNIRMSIQKAHYYPPSPASSGGSLGPMSPEVGLGMDDILTPPTTPPPNHLTEYFPKRDSRSTTSSSGSQARSSSTSGTRKSSNSTSSISMEHHRQVSRIKSVSSLNSTSSGSSSNRYSREKEHDPVPPLPTEFEAAKRTNTFGAAGPTSAPAPQLRTHKSTISTSSNASFTYSATNSPALTSGSSSPVVSVPARSSARMSRSASNPTLRNNTKSHRHHSGKGAANPFAHELAQVSELAEDMGLDFDEEYMARKGLLRFTQEDYLELIKDVRFPRPSQSAEPVVEKKEERLEPVVPLRKKPSILRREEERKMYASPAITAGQDGGWI